MKFLLSFICLTAAAFAQRPGAPPPDFSDLKTAIGITDAQIAQLQTIQQNEHTSSASTMQQIQTLRTSLSNLLKTASPSAAAVGQLYLQIDALQKQLAAVNTATSAQAVAVLSADQKTKLAQLQSALALEPAVREALGLNLLTPPQGAGGPGGRGPAGFGPVGFGRGGRGPMHGPPPAN